MPPFTHFTQFSSLSYRRAVAQFNVKPDCQRSYRRGSMRCVKIADSEDSAAIRNLISDVPQVLIQDFVIHPS
jgi:hypothetical protein